MWGLLCFLEVFLKMSETIKGGGSRGKRGAYPRRKNMGNFTLGYTLSVQPINRKIFLDKSISVKSIILVKMML